MGRLARQDPVPGADTEVPRTLASHSACLDFSGPHLRAIWLYGDRDRFSDTRFQNLLSDVLRISWARYVNIKQGQTFLTSLNRYHKDPGMQSRHMRLILNSPAPLRGDKVMLPVSVNSEQAETRFVAVRFKGYLRLLSRH